MTLKPDEFMRRFLLHVMPGGFHRIRHYGLLANARRKENLARARELLGQAAPIIDPPGAGVVEPLEQGAPTFVCSHCGAAMCIIETFIRGQAIRAPPQARVQV